MSSTSYLIQAFHLYDSIRLKGIRALLSGSIIDSSPQELQLSIGDDSYLFVYRFGCLVFFNVTRGQVEVEIGKLKAALGDGLSKPTHENYDVVLSGVTRVEFDRVQLKKLSLDYLRIIAQTLGQSAALEYFELNADRMVSETSSFMNDMSKMGTLPIQTRKLLQIIGSTAGTRQHIISNVAILDPPEEAWKSKELGQLYRELQQNFDIELRFKTLDRKLSLIQDNIEIIVDLTTSKRAFVLETAIVALIILEIFLALFRH